MTKRRRERRNISWNVRSNDSFGLEMQANDNSINAGGHQKDGEKSGLSREDIHAIVAILGEPKTERTKISPYKIVIFVNNADNLSLCLSIILSLRNLSSKKNDLDCVKVSGLKKSCQNEWLTS